jgi:hypothetical protein
LSNNGEFTSFPVPNTPNPLPPPQQIAALDRAASACNAGTIIDIPNGTGFCLYITRACLDAAGPLSDTFERGYLEDADLCLRARDHGFRSVCAASIYVGHAGSRSFGDHKRTLVMRNLKKLELRFPDYQAECAMFVKADPLQASRVALERAMPDDGTHTTLIVGGTGAIRAVMEARAATLLDRGMTPLIAEIHAALSDPVVRLRDPSKAVPQTLAFRLDDRAGFADYLRGVALKRIEIADVAAVPDALLDVLAGLGVPIDLFMANGGDATERVRAQWQAAERHAERIIAPSPMAREFAHRLLPGAPRIAVEQAPQTPPVLAGVTRPGASALGFLALGPRPADYRMMQNVLRRLRTGWPGLDIVVVGSTLDDIELMKAGNAFVTGSLGGDDLGLVIRQHGIKAMFAAVRDALFGHPDLSRLAALPGLPVASFDWSFGKVPAESTGLGIDPEADDATVAAALGTWFSEL